MEAFDVQEEQQELWVAYQNADTGDHPAEDQGVLALINAVIIVESTHSVRIARESLRRDIHHRDGTVNRGEEKEHLNTAGPLQHAMGQYVIRLCWIVKRQVHGGVHNREHEANATNGDDGDHDILQILVVVLSPLLINVVYQISACERKENNLYRYPGKEV